MLNVKELTLKSFTHHGTKNGIAKLLQKLKSFAMVSKAPLHAQSEQIAAGMLLLQTNSTAFGVACLIENAMLSSVNGKRNIKESSL